MTKCAVCGEKHENEWSWQPWGPDDDPARAFMFAGSHYRGFPVIKICDDCKEVVQAGATVTVTYKKAQYTISS